MGRLVDTLADGDSDFGIGVTIHATTNEIRKLLEEARQELLGRIETERSQDTSNLYADPILVVAPPPEAPPDWPRTVGVMRRVTPTPHDVIVLPRRWSCWELHLGIRRVLSLRLSEGTEPRADSRHEVATVVEEVLPRSWQDYLEGFLGSLRSQGSAGFSPADFGRAAQFEFPQSRRRRSQGKHGR
jgi:hypothetical protein